MCKVYVYQRDSNLGMPSNQEILTTQHDINYMQTVTSEYMLGFDTYVNPSYEDAINAKQNATTRL